MKSTLTKLSEDNFNVYAFDEKEDFNTVLLNKSQLLNYSTSHDNESDLENDFIKKLESLGYEYLKIHETNSNNNDNNSKKSDSSFLLLNLKKQLEKLNNVSFNDNEWKRIVKEKLCNDNDDFVNKTKLIQSDARFIFEFDDKSQRNIKLIDKENYHNNHLQVIHQYTPKDSKYKNRYDVTILINGLPIVHIELKTYKTSIQQAFNQINRYQYESFNDDYKLFQYVQIFIISNEAETKYFSNTTFDYALKNNSADQLTSNDFKSNSSFAFTNFWADQKNEKIKNLFAFTDCFLNKRTLQNILFRYCVFTASNELKVMRPYQIAACERILERINVIYKNYKDYESLKLPPDPQTNSSIKPGGYIWHATGSGKTLTSFKTAVLASQFVYIDKVIFVVDRKDLDYQTLNEYKKYGANLISDHNKNETSSAINIQATKSSSKLLQLLKQNNSDQKIIITTIQKLSRVLKQNKDDRLNDEDKKQLNENLKKRYVFIFDECHRTTFGRMFSEIQKNFKYFYLFGFTGTPIFNENKKENNNALNDAQTTQELFGKCLHSYTIYHALLDQKVLQFHVEWCKTFELSSEAEDIKKYNELIHAEQRIKNNCEFILKNYNRLVKAYHASNNKNKVQKFNAILATKDIKLAKQYYDKLKDFIDKNLYEDSTLKKIAIIYSYESNPDQEAIQKNFNVNDLEENDKYFLDNAIKDYNNQFNTNFSINNFDLYYKDVSKRLKDQELDLLIVVNMFLTGFDSPSLNTIFIDKKLRFHELIQTYSRTNRILDSIKDCGNIINFQMFQEEQKEAFSLYSDKNDIVDFIQTRHYKDYLYGYDDNDGHHKGLSEVVSIINELYPEPSKISELPLKDKKEYVNLITEYLKLTNKLASFTELDEKTFNEFLLKNENEYKGVYNNIKADFKKKYEETGDNSIYNGVTFDTKIIKNTIIDETYIANLIKDYFDSNKKLSIKEILLKISASEEYQNKQEAFKEFLESFDFNENNNVLSVSEILQKLNHFKTSYARKKLKEIIQSDNLKEKSVISLFNKWYKEQNIVFSGKDYSDLQKVSDWNVVDDSNNEYDNNKRKIKNDLIDFYIAYWDWIKSFLLKENNISNL